MGILRDGEQSAPPLPVPSEQLMGPTPTPMPTPTPTVEPVAQSSELRRRRDRLAEQVTELHWDLGGLAYEMAIRDHFRLDVLIRRAAVLQERDAELAEVERLLRMEEHGVAGACAGCGAPHSRGALYCWQCGSTLMERLPSSLAGGRESQDDGLRELLAAAASDQPAARIVEE